MKIWWNGLKGSEKTALFALSAIFTGVLVFLAGVQIGEGLAAL
jgi:hypothetical protein